MSDREFDNYLTLLAGLLRLDRKQQDAIAGELRTHLEDRLDDLLARGVARDEAVRQALAEFGDAAGLAAQFVSLSRNRKRRWLMRTASFSAAAVLLLAAGLITFWPGPNAGPGPAAVVAQSPEEPAKKEPAAKPAAKGPTVSDKLDQRIDCEFVDTPLKDVLDFLADMSNIQIYINQKRLEEVGIATDIPVSKSLKQVRLSTLLDLILDELGLVYVEKDDLLVITTREDADVNTEVRVYDCRDLFAMPAPPVEKKVAIEEAAAGGPPAMPGAFGGIAGEQGAKIAPLSAHELRAQRLMNIITTAVEPMNWQEVGGFGTISEYNGLIVISQSARTHAKVEKVFDMLRQAAGLEKPKGGSVVR
jgi:hypothetical protein